MKDYIFIFPMSLPNGRVWTSKDLSEYLKCQFDSISEKQCLRFACGH